MQPAETALVVNALRKHPAFRSASRRLLTDLVENLEPTTLQAPVELESIDGRLIVLGGALTIYGKNQPQTTFLPGQIVDPACNFVQSKLHIKPTKAGGKAQFLYLKNKTLETAMIVSPTLVRSLYPETHLNSIWVCAHDERLPIEALTFLLGEAIGNDWETDQVAIVVFKRTPELWIRTGGERETFTLYSGGVAPPIDEFEPTTVALVKGEPSEVNSLAAPVEDGRPRVNEAEKGHADPLLKFLESMKGPGFWHVLFVNPADPVAPPGAFGRLKFHQLVYLTGAPVDEVPADLRGLLLNEKIVRDRASTRFNVFVPTILLPLDADLDAASGDWLSGREEKFATVSVTNGDGAACDPACAPLDRDSCRLRFDIAGIARDWSNLADPASFAVVRFRKNDTDRRRASRWARAVTDRRVGVALSGGGASAFRAVALLHELERQGVPVDVIGGVSGGALVSAYYAKEEMAGLERCVRSASDFQRASLLGMINSWFIERQVDRDLEGARVEDMEIRLAAVAGALSEDQPPEACVVTHGRLGEAVRVSGSLPLGFGPTQKGDRRFADGSTAAPVPVDMVRLLGADVVIAFNFIPGARRGNPFGDTALGRFLYRNTPVGRVIDAWVSASFLLRQISATAMEAADVALEAQSANYPLTEMLDWAGARKIVARGFVQDGPEIVEKVRELRRAWLHLGRQQGGK